MDEPRKILIIQTASIGDVILTTPIVESLAERFPGSQIDFMLKKGTESLLMDHPHIRKILVWDKSKGKYRRLFDLLNSVRKEKYDLVVNAQRFLATGIITAFSGARIKAGFDKNPLAFMFTHKVKHIIGEKGIHEVDRNLALIRDLTGQTGRKVRLYPSEDDYGFVSGYKSVPFICIAPASLWFTKQYPVEKWIEFIKGLDEKYKIYLLGSASDQAVCQQIMNTTMRDGTECLAGKLTLLQTAALMKDAVMNFVNDSAPLHLASAVNAPVTAIFCSTVTDFGFGPLSDNSAVVETRLSLPCRPCGLHGYRECPEKHFKCAYSIDNNELLNRVRNN